MNTGRFSMFLAVMLAVMLAYLGKTYLSLFEHEPAYLYHPASDRLYELSLTASLAAAGPVWMLDPRTTVHYGEPYDAMYLGRVASLRQKLEKESLPDRREGESVDEWMKRMMKDLDDSLAGHRYTDIQYFERRDTSVDEISMPSGTVLHGVIASAKRDAMVVDAVAMTWSVKGGSPETIVLEDAVMIPGNSAVSVSRYLESLGAGY